MRLYRESGEARDRIGDDLLDGLRVVDDAIDKGGIGTVLEQSPHQVGQQILVVADRCINAARPIHPIEPDDPLVKRLAHPVQALELVIAALAGKLEDRRDGMRVVGGELRVAERPQREQPPRAGEIGDIGRDLAGVDRVPVEPALLGTFDLTVPIGPFDEADHQPPPAPPGQIGEPLDDRKSPLLIGLHGEAKPVPTGKVGGKCQILEKIEREVEAVGLLGIDRQADADPPCVAREVEEHGEHFGKHPIALCGLVSRVQRRQFDRDTGSLGDSPARRRPTDRSDGAVVGGGVARGIRRGMRRFAEHVVGMPVAVLLGSPRPLERLLDRAPHNELTAEDMHRGGYRLAHHRFARAGNKTAQGGAQIVLGRFGAQQAAGQHQRPSRGVDKDRARASEMAFPVRLTDLVPDQPVDGLRIGDAQQCFGETQKSHPLGRGQRVFVQKRVDAALAEPLATDGGD